MMVVKARITIGGFGCLTGAKGPTKSTQHWVWHALQNHAALRMAGHGAHYKLHLLVYARG